MVHEFPKQVENGNAVQIILSPQLDQKAINQSMSPEDILKKNIKIGGSHLLEQAIHPVIKPVEDATDNIGGAFGQISETIHDAMYVPIRGFFIMGNVAATGQLGVYQTFLGTFSELFGAVKRVVQPISSIGQLSFYSAITTMNTIVSVATVILEVLMAGVGILMTLSFMFFLNPFTIPLGILVETLGVIAEITLGIALSQIKILQRMQKEKEKSKKSKK